MTAAARQLQEGGKVKPQGWQKRRLMALVAAALLAASVGPSTAAAFSVAAGTAQAEPAGHDEGDADEPGDLDTGDSDENSEGTAAGRDGRHEDASHDEDGGDPAADASCASVSSVTVCAHGLR